MDFYRDILPLKDRLFRLALRLTGRREEAEDCVQEVMLRIYAQRATLVVSSPEAYALTLTRNLALDILRRHGRHTVPLDTAPDSGGGSGGRAPTVAEREGCDPYPALYARESLRRISDILASLPEKQSTAMHLRDFDGRSYREIAQIMNITEDQVKVNIFRARKAVRERLTGD